MLLCREHAESLVISNDLLRQELGQLKSQGDVHAMQVARLEATSVKLDASLKQTQAWLHSSQGQLREAIEARDSALQGEEEALSALDRERLKETDQIAALTSEVHAAKAFQVRTARLLLCPEKLSLILSVGGCGREGG